jgi:hypothetical protein
MGMGCLRTGGFSGKTRGGAQQGIIRRQGSYGSRGDLRKGSRVNQAGCQEECQDKPERHLTVDLNFVYFNWALSAEPGSRSSLATVKSVVS